MADDDTADVDPSLRERVWVGLERVLKASQQVPGMRGRGDESQVTCKTQDTEDVTLAQS